MGRIRHATVNKWLKMVLTPPQGGFTFEPSEFSQFTIKNSKPVYVISPHETEHFLIPYYRRIAELDLILSPDGYHGRRTNPEGFKAQVPERRALKQAVYSRLNALLLERSIAVPRECTAVVFGGRVGTTYRAVEKWLREDQNITEYKQAEIVDVPLSEDFSIGWRKYPPIRNSQLPLPVNFDFANDALANLIGETK